MTMTILHYMGSSSTENVLENPYFFCENGDEYSWKRCAEEIEKGLQKADTIRNPIPREIPGDLYDYVFGEWSLTVIGQNARN
jgi:hypothetical protein